MKNTNRLALVAAALIAAAFSLPSWAADDAPATTCKDGTTSTATGRGACSGHGGVQKKSKSSAGSDDSSAPSSSAPSMPTEPPASTVTTTCKDGTTSMATGRGACSGHGGMQKSKKSTAEANPAGTMSASPSAPAAPAAGTSQSPSAAAPGSPAKAPTVAADNTDPTGATAKCKDGTYSKSKHHRGTCSKHGGVAEWVTQ